MFDIFYRAAIGSGWEKVLDALRRAIEFESVTVSAHALGEVSFGDENRPCSSESDLVARTQRWAEIGDTAAQYRMGVYYSHGMCRPKDEVEAFGWFHKAAKGGSLEAGFEVAKRLHIGSGVKQDEVECQRWCQIVAEEKLREERLALERHTEAASRGDADGKYALGCDHKLGLGGLPPNPGRAIELFQEAAAGGHVSARRHLFDCYLRGLDVERDVLQAVDWLLKASEPTSRAWPTFRTYEQSKVEQLKARDLDGSADAEAELALLLEKQKDDKETLILYKRRVFTAFRDGAERGTARTQYELACMHTDDFYFHKDLKTGLRWLRRSARRGHPEAQFMLGFCYLNGLWTLRKNRHRAMTWLDRAGRADRPLEAESLAFQCKSLLRELESTDGQISGS